VPLLLFMGIVLHYSGIADELQTCLQRLFRKSPAGLAIATLLIGTILAPAAGMIGASVVTLALIALPLMLEQGYKPSFASGVVAAAGTLGVAFPPGVMLVFVAAAMGVYAPFIFLAMLGPSLLLLVLFGSYCMVVASSHPALVSATPRTDYLPTLLMYLRSLIIPLALITLMILAVTVGYLPIAEAAAVGAAGALLLSIFPGRFNRLMLRRSVVKTTSITAMIFFIFIGASIFNLMFRLVGGFDAVSSILTNLQMGSWGILGVILLTLFVLGFFVDWIELVIVSFSLFRPALDALDFSAMIHSPILALSWITVLITMTLQISFLTPPFGYALFFLKGSAPSQIRMKDIYRGVAPFVFLSIFAISCVAAFPSIATWLPGKILSLNVNQKENVREAQNGGNGSPVTPLLCQFDHVPAVVMLNSDQDGLPPFLAHSTTSHNLEHR